ncbi:MAG: C39 family peptidase [Clostridiales bacterium]|nr:C39 family peptidase [Clostridiales bacterium]
MSKNKINILKLTFLAALLGGCFLTLLSGSAPERRLTDAAPAKSAYDLWQVWKELDSGPFFSMQATKDHSQGIMTSDTGTQVNLMVQWEAAQPQGQTAVDLTIKIYLVYEGSVTLPEKTGNRLTVNDKTISFAVDEAVDYPQSASPLLLYVYRTKEQAPAEGEFLVHIAAEYDFNADIDGYHFDTLCAQGTVIISDKYRAMPEQAAITLDVVRQYPELPNGCETTSLTMVLNHLDYTVSKMDLKNQYLPIGSANFYQYNIGDPADRHSYGCYSPVIADTAGRFLRENGEEHQAFDLTHYDIQEIYYQVSIGHPVIVWITQDLQTKPSITRVFKEEDESYYWKGPLHCVVLTGYDQKENTVTWADPLYGVKTGDMTLFETRWHQMGEQAVAVY